MKRIYIDAPTLMGGVYYESSPVPQSVPDAIADHLVQIGNARYFETKVVEVMETKKLEPAVTSSLSPQAQALPEKTAPRRGRPKLK